jgi:hypothetical protein
MKTNLLILSVAAAFFAALSLPSDSRTGAIPVPPSRCCFEISVVDAGLFLQVRYPACNHEEPCSDAEREYWTGGYHTILAGWHGEWLARYSEVNRIPYLASAALTQRSGARVQAGLEDKVDWGFPSNAQYVGISGGMERTTNGWMATKQMLSFVGAGDYLHVAPGPAIWNTVAMCGSSHGGVSYHGRSLARADWDGLEGPWQWVVKGPTRAQFRHATTPFVVNVSDGPIKKQESRGGRFHYVNGSDGLFITFKYFPEKDLAKKLGQFAKKYPITSSGLKTVSNVLLDNTRTPIGGCEVSQP